MYVAKMPKHENTQCIEGLVSTWVFLKYTLCQKIEDVRLEIWELKGIWRNRMGIVEPCLPYFNQENSIFRKIMWGVM